MQCEQFRLLSDSYINNELLIETNHEIISHLERCADCRRELVARRELRRRLRKAFQCAPANQITPDFMRRLGTELREYALAKRGDPPLLSKPLQLFGTSQRTVWITLAACLLLATVPTLVLVWQRLSPAYTRTQVIGQAQQINNNSRQQRTDETKSSVPVELVRSAVGNHRDCAIHFRLSEKPIDLELAGRKYDPVFINLTEAIVSHVNTVLDVTFVESHSCVFEGRRFAHIVLKYGGRLVSFLVTEAVSANEIKENLRPTMLQSQVIECSQFEGYQVSSFHTERHCILIVSDLPESEILTLSRALMPSAFAHITAIERAV